MRRVLAVAVGLALLAACGNGDDDLPRREGRNLVPEGVSASLPDTEPHLRFMEEASPDDRELKLALDEGHCIGEADAMLGDVDVVETAETVTITAHLTEENVDTSQCTRGTALYVPVSVVLDAPRGTRRILDGSCTPPADVPGQFEGRQPCDATPEEKAKVSAVGTWASFEAGPLSPRGEPKGAWNGRELIVVGGLAIEQYRALRDGAAYNPATKTWRRIPDLPVQGRVHAVAPTADGLLALMHPGGELSIFEGSAAFEYTASSDAWKAVPPPKPYTYPHAMWTGTEVIVWGANGGAIFDPRTDAWREIPAMSVAGGATSGMASGGVSQWIADPGVLAVRGDFDPRDGSPPRSALFLFDPDTNKWGRAADPPGLPQGFGSFVVRSFEVFDRFEGAGSPVVYDAKRDEWRPIAPFEGSDERDGGTAYFTGVDLGDGRGVVRLGSSAKPLRLLDIAAGTWSHAASPGKLPAPDAVLAWTGDTLLLWGRPANISPGDRNAAWAWTPPK